MNSAIQKITMNLSFSHLFSLDGVFLSDAPNDSSWFFGRTFLSVVKIFLKARGCLCTLEEKSPSTSVEKIFSTHALPPS